VLQDLKAIETVLMPVDILMPALSPSMEKANLIQWMRAVGDSLLPDDVVAEVETDKATMEVVAGAEGVLANILIPAGTPDVPVHQVIGRIATGNENAGSVAPAATAHPDAEKQVSEERATTNPTAAPHLSNDGLLPRVFASPIARRLIKEAGLSVASIVGTGPHGRIVERDVKAAMAAATTAPRIDGSTSVSAVSTPELRVASSPTPLRSSEPIDNSVRALFPPGTFDEVPHNSVRLAVARRLVEAKQSIPHFYLSADCEADSLLALRRQLNEAAPIDQDKKPTYRLSINDFVIKALAVALRQVPDANVSFIDGSMLRHRHADISVAVAIPDGLITPIVRQAETKSLSTIASEMDELAARARMRKLRPEEYQGGTAGLSNLGMYGVSSFFAVINPPQATILAVGAAQKRLIARGEVAASAMMMTVTLSTDHRALDGATAAKLLAAFKRGIENPMMLLV
jgi:pyruvate dehydrogenase E2 component (dihydrolipoamide acetyltransferase)